MYMIVPRRPKQKVSYAEKSKNEFEWAKQNIVYYAGLATRSNFAQFPQDEKRDLYYCYYNMIPERFFHNVTNPINSSKEEFRNYPVKLKSYNIINTNINLLLGEWASRPFTHTVNVNNPDAQSIMLNKLKSQIREKLEQYYVDIVNEKKVEMPDLQALIKDFHEDYKDDRVIEGQDALEYIKHDKLVHHLLCEGLFHFLIVGDVITYKNAVRDDVEYEVVNPLEMSYDTSVEWIEDGEFAVRRTFISPSKLLEMFWDEITDDELEKIDDGNIFYTAPKQYIRLIEDLVKEVNTIELIHTVWKTMKKVGVLTYYDSFGQEQQMEVPEEYKPKKNEKVKWIWINEVWEGYRANGNMFFRVRPIPAQRNLINQKATCKLPYNGRKYTKINVPYTSLVKLCLPYQILYITVMYMFELCLSRHGGKILLLDKSVIPNNDGWDEEKFLYYAKALGFAIIDRNTPNADKSFNQYSVLNAETISEAVSIMQVLAIIRQELDLMLGISPERKAQSVASTVGATTQSIYQSSLISEEIFRMFDVFVVKELQGLMDVSKFAWLEGKKASFIGSDLRTIILNIDGTRYASTEYGINVSNSTSDRNKLEKISQIIQPMAQNGYKPSTIVELVNAENLTKLQKVLKKAEDIAQQQAQQAQQMQGQTELEIQSKTFEIQKNLEILKSDLEKDRLMLEYEKKKEIEYIKQDAALFAANSTEDVNDNNIPDINEIAQREQERIKMHLENSAKMQELALKEKEMILKAGTEKYKADKGLEIAKENRNKYDKKT